MKNRGFTPLEFFKNFFRAKRNNQKTLTGFTLIELLVVIAIIGLLASIVMVSLNSARAKARDINRKAALKQIQTALELYYDKYDTYPDSGVAVCNPGLNEHGDAWCRDTTNNNGITPIQNWIPGLQEFLPNMPHNPQPYASGYWPFHYYSPSKSQYWLMTGLENSGDKEACGGGAVYTWFEGSNTCSWWGNGLYVRFVK